MPLYDTHERFTAGASDQSNPASAEARGPSGMDGGYLSVGRCHFIDGVHRVRGIDCPHDNLGDEMGTVIATGWTVQQR